MQRKFKVTVKIKGSKYLGEFIAGTEEEAVKLALKSSPLVLCKQCAEQCGEPYIYDTESEEVGPEFNMKTVVSSNIGLMGYDPAYKMLRITFKNGLTYDYLNVDNELFENLNKSESKGSFIAKFVKNTCPCVKVEGENG